MGRRARSIAALLAVVGVSITSPSALAHGRSTPPLGPAAELDLAAQTPVVEPGGAFVMRLEMTGVPDDGSVQVIVHQRVRSRSELAQSMEGEGLRSEAFSTAQALTELPVQPDGTHRLALSLDPASGVSLSAEGVYPVEVIAQDATGNPLASLVTHLIIGPEAGDDAPSLGVAVVAEVGAPPALQPDGREVLSRGDVEDMAGVVAGLTAAPTVPATVAARPETIDALLASAEPGDVELVEALRTSVSGRTVLSLPYVEVSPDSLATASLLDGLRPQLDKGSAVLSEELGVEPVGDVAMSPPDLGGVGLAALALLGAQRIVVASDQVEPLDPGVISYSLAQPFLLTPPEDAREEGAVVLPALATDPVVIERLDTVGAPGLVASRVLAELALLRLEQPSIARSVVLPLEPDTPGAVVQLLLDGVGSGRPFEAMTLDQAFDHAGPLLDAADEEVDRALLPTSPEQIGDSVGRDIKAARADLDTFAGLVGPDSPTLEPLDRHLLVAMASGLRDDTRRAHVAAVDGAIDLVSDGVTTPETFTLTLAAREGTIPLTIRNDSGLPLRVSVRLRSQKLEFPEGEPISLLLEEPSTRIDIPVRARSSGAFPLQIDVMTPDGQRRLATSRYTVRSTAVSGAGLVLSVGAGAFLVLWWARHWHRTRRSARLVAAHAHPATRAGK